MSTRSQNKKAPKILDGQLTKRIENSWVLMMKDSVFENNSFCFITLPHPSTGSPVKCCLDDSNKKLYEVMTFSEPNRSWFIGEKVKSDGNLQMITPINPLFLLLPRLKELCSNRAIPLEDLLSDKGFDKIVHIVSNLEEVADLKKAGDIEAYKYNENKTLIWLENRIKKLANVLRNKNIHVTSGAISATFVASNVNNDNIDEEFYLKYACGIVSEYLEDDMVEKIEKYMNFSVELVEHIGSKRKIEVEDNSSNKRMKCDLNSDDENIKNNLNVPLEVKKQKPLSAKEKARQKAASGTKTISAFFTKE